MKKLILFVAFYCSTQWANAQMDTAKANTPELKIAETEVKKTKKKYNLSNRPNDHFMLQLGYTQWIGTPDSIDTKGFSKSINTYFMFDFPFKTTQQLSAAIGLGVGSDHIYFDRDYPDIKGQTSTLRFERSPDTTFYKKSKLVTTYLEAPVELRYVSNPEKSDKSFKLAIGVKVGTMLKAGTRARTLMNYSPVNSNTVSTVNDYVVKESSKKYFNTTRVVGTARVGYGHFTLFTAYQFSNLLKEGTGPNLKPFTIGLTISGL